MSIALTLAALATAATLQADAGWELRSVKLSFSGANSWQGDAIPVVVTAGDDVIGAAILCDASSYQVRFALRKGKMADAVFGSQRRKIRDSRLRLYVDDEMVWDGQGQKYTSLGSVIAVGSKPAAQVFNAVIREQNVSYRLGGGKAVPVDLPPVDDSFSAFATACKSFQNK